MPTYRLRYRATDFDLPDGEFTVGRSSTSHLVLDDALVSRSHAVFRRRGNLVEVDDLGSRNGVLVNAVKIQGPTQLNHLDRVMIGTQELTLIDEREHASDRKTIDTGSIDLMEAAAAASEAASDEETHVLTGLSLLLSIADKALNLERFDEAERILARHLENLLARIEGGETPPRRESIETAAQLAIQLAEGLGKASWLDWVFNVHRAAGFPPRPDAVDALHTAVRSINYRDPRPLRECLRALSQVDDLSAADRFVVSRLAGLEKVISA